MLCSVTVLGARNGSDASAAAGKIVDYLKGQRPDTGRPLRNTTGQAAADPGEPARYYGDSAEDLGQWLGSGFGDVELDGAVDSDAFASLLLGNHPTTGEQLISNAGSAARANGARPASERIDPAATYGLREAAALVGVGRPYLQKLAKTTAARAAGDEVPNTYLDAVQAGPNRRWEVSGTELQRFAQARESQAVVLGYDVTFSCPKSVSLLWARVDPDTRAEILAAVDSSVRAGMAYLEEYGCTVKVGTDLVAGGGFQAAGFLHATSRALDPQLHWHCVVINATTGPTGKRRAIDARSLFAHARTAGYLAGAQLRHELTERLGVAWTSPHNGLADIEGIERSTIEAFAKRSTEIDEVAQAAGLRSAAGRQSAALSTRAAKSPVASDELIHRWHDELDRHGFTIDAADDVLGRTTVAGIGPTDRDQLFRLLLGPHGLTELSSVFDRRDVLQAVAEWAGSRLTAEEISHLADDFLAGPDIVILGRTSTRPGLSIQRVDGRTVKGDDTPIYTCQAMLDLEASILDRLEAGFGSATAMVPNEALEAAIRSQSSLGADQAVMVEQICTSGDRIQCVLGPAGSGKTFALEVATRAWESHDHRVVGVAVAGVAAEVLSRSLGIQTDTVASLLTRLDLSGPAGVLDDRTVVLVDEASTIGTRDLARLLAWTDRTGAAVRLVGDPAQHSAVSAGGMFRHLVERHAERVPELTVNRRQHGHEMGEVRLALAEYREGKIADALDRLDRDQRVVTADTADELLDALVADWYVDRQRRVTEPGLASSSMVAEHHFERAELNQRARTMLEADGTIHGPALEAGGHTFQAGDDVICRAQNRDLRPAGGNRRSYLRNGNRGTVLEVDLTPDHHGLLVDFDGKGPIFVPRSYLEAEVRPHVAGGLTHAYALTSHASQGDTYEAGRHLATDQSSREGVYVGLTRGRTDVRIYTVNRSDLVPRIDDDPSLPRLERETIEARQAVAARLAATAGELLATEHDHLGPDARQAAEQLPAVELRRRATAEDPDPSHVRAWHARRLHLAAEARHHPTPEILDAIGPRPGPGAARSRWDRVAAAVAEHHAVHPDTTTPDASAEWSQLQPSIDALRLDATQRSQDLGPNQPEPRPEPVPTPVHSVGTIPILELER
jgi:conjugative relaxase-like TrwC/TraI family protein